MPKIVDHDAYREELLSKAYTLFASRGYGSVTMRDMAREVGVSTGTLYHYFDTKEEIFNSAVEYVARRDVALAMESVRQAKSLDERFRLLVRFVGQREKDLRHFVLLVLDFYRQARRREAREMLSRTLGFYRDAITRQMGERPDEGMAALMLSVFIGSLIQGLIDPQCPSLEDQSALLRQLLGDDPAATPSFGT